ncbi:MAG: type II methionyl aminopeptidase [Candidatus Nanoarchaeia archaeon]|nr:type II methionyl aminopeptidase [Candidatus Nanoarchaeia archaeon]
MLEQNKNDFLKAGKITGIAREFAFKTIKENLNIYNYVKSIEEKIYSLGGKLAFPVNISINEFAAHDTPNFKGFEEFKQGQLVKVDLGAMFNGFLGDTAFTAEINSDKYSKLILASKEALENAIKIIKPGVKHCEVGKIVHKTIKEHGFNPIFNLGGHGLGRYNLHSDIFIPNYDNGNSSKFIKGQMIAIEPFATTGVGKIGETNISKIYCFVKKKPVRMESSKKILNYIEENFNYLPFANYHLMDKFSSLQVSIALKEFTKMGIVHAYPQLREISKGMVSQFEHTLFIDDETIVTTI